MDESPSSLTQSESVSSSASSAESRHGKKVRRSVLPVLDKKFQIKVTLSFLLLILISHLFLITLHYRNLSAVGNTVGKTVTQVESIQQRQKRIFLRDLILGTLVIGAMVGLVVFYLTQRVSGPLFSMSRTLEEMARGNFDARVKLRKGDELHWFAEKINETQEALKQKYS